MDDINEIESTAKFETIGMDSGVEVCGSDGDSVVTTDDASNAESFSSCPATNFDNTTSDDFETKRGERAILFSRTIFFVVLIAAAAVLSSVVFVVQRNEEEDDFQSQLRNTAEEFILLSNHNVEAVFGALHALSSSATSLVKSQHEETGYPEGFITIPDAEDQLLAARNSTGALVISYMPHVTASNYDDWMKYCEEHKRWLSEAHNTTKDVEITPFIWEYLDQSDEPQNRMLQSCSARRALRKMSEGVKAPSDRLKGPFFPVWTMSPVPEENDTGIINYNLVDRPVFQRAVNHITKTRLPVFLDVCDQSAWFGVATNKDILQTVVAFPVFSNFENDSSLAGVFTAIVPWTRFFSDNFVDDGGHSIILVVSNTCNEIFSFEVNGGKATFLGEEDFHDRRYDGQSIQGPFAAVYNPSAYTEDADHCIYTLDIYPTEEFEETYKTNEPLYFSLGVVAIFVFTTLVFFIFDFLVQRRQAELADTARKQNAIVSSLFPKSIHQKLMTSSRIDANNAKNDLGKKNGKAGLKTFLNNGETNKHEVTTAEPIADLFPETTVMFGDISNFTAWSSTREPRQVFALLEGVYAEFDVLAKRRGVFKVEVVGDCYVAVCGLPDPRPDHAVVMAKFAKDCVFKMKEVVHNLEVKLGPDTTDLKLRVGIHSGPVVAGVLRGDRSRFQLFGDTMNTASRMESTGIPDGIQLSQETADHLNVRGKGHWLIRRDTLVQAKGKGEMQTFFLDTSKMAKPCSSALISASSACEVTLECQQHDTEEEKKKKRSAEWIVEIMASHLRAMVHLRKSAKLPHDPKGEVEQLELDSMSQFGATKKTPIDDVAEAIQFPKHTSGKTEVFSSKDIGAQLDTAVVEELTGFVESVASLYNENPFHNFAHATHVAMSVNKLLSRISATDTEEHGSSDLQDHTYGIRSDPLTWFACVFTALIHDVDHSGVPNAQLVKEQAPVAKLYHGKSVAEQNSFDMAWDLLMEPSYQNLRNTIYVTKEEFQRFRQLVVNGVMATDIVDKDLKLHRNKRWDSAFDLDEKGIPRSRLKATIVIEHLIQASDVAHTMQHWSVYRKWNERLFQECFQAYILGRADKDPTDGWYLGELGFFDYYIIPLAKKLKECGVFGVSSDEYLLYAQQNRSEWEKRGKQVVEEMTAKAKHL